MVTKCRALARFKRRQPRTAHEPCPDCINIIVPEGLVHVRMSLAI